MATDACCCCCFLLFFYFQLPLHVVVDIRHLLIRKAAFARLEVLYTALETGIDELADLTYNLGNVTIIQETYTLPKWTFNLKNTSILSDYLGRL